VSGRRAPASLYRLEPYRDADGEKCRCGSRLSTSRGCVRFEQVPGPLVEIVGDRGFCGVVCARAFILEALALVESSAAPAVLSEIEEVQQSLRLLLTLIEIEQFARPSLQPPARA
jgi:hypothetical protein